MPPGTLSRHKFPLKERGIPSHPPGGLYVILQIVLPPADSEQAKILYWEME